MDCANVTKYILPHLPNAIPRPLTSMRCTKKISRQAGNAFSPPVAALLLVLTKRSVAPAHRMPEEILRMPNAKSLLTSHSVVEM